MNNIIRSLLPGLWVFLLLAGCAHQAPPREGNAYAEIQQSLDQAVQSNVDGQSRAAPPPEVTAALLSPPVQVVKPGKKEPRFDITVSLGPARNFFMGLIEGADYNMVIHPEVDGDISLALRNVTIHDVMQTVQRVYGYEYEYYQDNRTFHVLPIRLRSRIFQIDYLSLTRSGTSGTRVSSGEITQAVTTGENTSSDTTSSNQTLTSSEITTQSSSDFWNEITQALKTIIGTDEGRSVVVNPHTGLLVIRAMPSELRQVERFLAKTQINLHKQVILEAKILEVELNDQFQAGINWAAVVNGGNNKFIQAGQTGGGSIFNNNSGSAGSSLGTATPGFPATTPGNTFSMQPGSIATALGSSAFGGVFSLALSLNDFVGFIELLEGQGNVQVLSSPRIATINNQKAVIKVGSDEFFITDIETSTNTSSINASNNTDVEFTPFFSGIALDVTPQINDENVVTLHVHPKISEVSSSLRSIPLAAGGVQDVELARSTVRESDTIIRARSGQIVVIGGLMQNLSSERTAAPPVLGDLPMMGAAFRNKQQSARKSELVILLRPLVIDSDNDWQQSLQRSQQHITALNPGFNNVVPSNVSGNQTAPSAGSADR